MTVSSGQSVWQGLYYTTIADLHHNGYVNNSNIVGFIAEITHMWILFCLLSKMMATQSEDVQQSHTAH